MSYPPRFRAEHGFTLIELSIVLVIIGLIIGGVLVGQDLITSSSVRAQISQIEGIKSAINTFRLKYGYLPGDIPDPTATGFGFIARGNYVGQGDGDGLILGNMVNTSAAAAPLGTCLGIGEPATFWNDLGRANLVGGSYVGPSSTPTNGWGVAISGATLDTLFPKAKIGRNNSVYAYSGGSFSVTWTSTWKNYLGVAIINSLNASGYYPDSSYGMAVHEAYNIDTKTDDGLPQTGKVLAQVIGISVWFAGASGTAATPASSSTCFDNSNVASATQKYSMSQNSGNGINCAMGWQF